MIGETLSRYRIVQEIGVGGMGKAASFSLTYRTAQPQQLTTKLRATPTLQPSVAFEARRLL